MSIKYLYLHLVVIRMRFLLIIFGTNVAKQVRNQMVLYFPTSLSDSALPGKTRKHETAFPDFNQSLLDFFNFVEMQLIFTLL